VSHALFGHACTHTRLIAASDQVKCIFEGESGTLDTVALWVDNTQVTCATPAWGDTFPAETVTLKLSGPSDYKIAMGDELTLELFEVSQAAIVPSQYASRTHASPQCSRCSLVL
jgi:hypothetical protein